MKRFEETEKWKFWLDKKWKYLENIKFLERRNYKVDKLENL